MSKPKTSDCTRCINRLEMHGPRLQFRQFRCMAHGFYVGDTVMNCARFKAK